MAGLPDDADIEFDLEYRFSDELVEKAFEIGRARAELASRQAELTHQTSGVIRELNARGFAVRDTARLLDMTPGRVSQIANG